MVEIVSIELTNNVLLAKTAKRYTLQDVYNSSLYIYIYIYIQTLYDV